jgi:DNA adenine methylase
LSNWIQDHIPEHRTYVEVFGGSASVLVDKPRSKVEVYNDRDGDLVHFFRTFRERTDEIVEFLRRTPYSRDLHEKWANQYFAGYRPDDDVERAARFFYLRFSQYGGKYRTKSGFKSYRQRNAANHFKDARERLSEFADRFDGVIVENLDYADLFDRFEGERTVFYCDPPYVQEGDALYTGDEFDHGRLVDELQDLQSLWIVSYTDLPDGLRDLSETVVSRDVQFTKKERDGSQKQSTERLCLNFDPESVARHSDSGQQTLGSIATDGGVSDGE